jgi:iron complex outermembrane receptor protein
MRSNSLLLQRLASVAGIAIIFSLASPSYAQTANGPSGKDDQVQNFDEIVVTARKTGENLQNVPISITALTSETLARSNIQDSIEIAHSTPGLYATAGQLDSSSVYFTIRGQSSAGGFYESSVGVYVDGVYRQSQYGLNGALYDLERIEVLKGPQGTLYGKNTSAGVINYISRKPILGEMSGYVKATAGAYANDEIHSAAAGIEGALNIPLNKDTLALRIAGSYKYDGGTGIDGNGRKLNTISYPSVRAQLRWQPDSNWDVVLAGDYGAFRSNGLLRTISESNPGSLAIAVGVNAGLIAPADIPSAANGNVPGPSFISGLPKAVAIVGRDVTDGKFYKSNGTSELFSNVNVGGVALTVDGSLAPGLSVKSISAYRRLKNANQNDVDGTSYDQFLATFRNDQEFYSQEFDFSGNLAQDRLHWLSGAYYSHFTDRRGGIPGIGTAALIALSGVRTQFDSAYKAESLGFFGHATYDLSDRLSLTGGLRWSQDSRSVVPLDKILSADGKTVIGCQNVLVGALPLTGGTVANGCTFPTQRHKDSGISYELALNYKITPEVMAYGTTRRGFRAGDINTNAQYGAYNPEFATDYEIGLKSEFLDRRARFNIAGYYTDYSDIQKSSTVVVLGPPIAFGTAVTNAAKARIWGIEADARLIPFTGFELTAGYTYTNARYRQFMVPSPSGGTIDRSQEVFEIPAHMINAEAQYTVPVGTNSVTFGGNWYYQSDIVFGQTLSLLPSEPILRQNGYSLFGLRFSYDMKQTDTHISIFVKNLTDKEYTTGAGSLRTVGISYLIPGRPRFIGAEIKQGF